MLVARPGQSDTPSRSDYELPLKLAHQAAMQRRVERSIRIGLAALRRGLEPGLAVGIRGVALIESRLAWSWELRYLNPGAMLQHAQSAAVESLNFLTQKEAGGARLLAALRTRAISEYANALRVNDQFGAAQKVLGRAFACYRESTGDNLLRARLLDIQATLLADQRQYGLAHALFGKELEILGRAQRSESIGRVLIAKAKCYVDAGNPGKSLPLLRRSLAMIDPAQDPDLELAARFNLVWAKVQNGDYRENQEDAWNLLEAYRQRGQPMNLLRTRWLGAKILFGLGAIRKAFSELSAVRDGFIAAKLPYDAALVGMELASAQ